MKGKQTLTITQPDDMHLHLRDGDALKSVVNATGRQFARAIIMPNLKPPVTKVAQALEYRQRIVSALEAESNFNPLMTLYLTDNTSADDIKEISDSEHVYAIKYYPAGATTNSDSGVTDIKNVMTVLEAMAEAGVPLLVHGEVTDPEVDVFDREAVFIQEILEPLLNDLPELKLVFEHITTRDAVEFVMGAETNVAATITPQHLLLNRNALFAGGIRPHHYCLPVLKAEQHREAILAAAVSGNPRFFLGTDSAPHEKAAKESSCGCAGIYSAYSAIEIYAEAFENADSLDKLENFASVYGAEFYGLPRNENTITLEKQDWQIPEALPFMDTQIIPFRGGENCAWKLK